MKRYSTEELKAMLAGITPGPYYAAGTVGGDIAVLSKAGGRIVTVRTTTKDISEETAAANARAIAALPAILAQLVECREALAAAIKSGEFVVRLCEANVKAGDSPHPTEKADWVGTTANCYAAMNFLPQARAALGAA